MNATLRRVGALVDKDLMDLIKNPTMLVVLLMPIGFMLLFRLVIGDTAADAGLTGADLASVGGEIDKFLLGSGLCMSIGMVASMVLIYGIAEEKEKHTLRTLMLANVGAGEVAASKGGVTLLAVVAVGAACFFLAGGEPGLLPVYLALTALGAVPVVLISLVLGLASRDQMTAGFYSVPVLLLALVPTFGMASEAIKTAASFTPLGGVYDLLGLAYDGHLLSADALMPLAVTLAWAIAGAAVFAALYRRLARDNRQPKKRRLRSFTPLPYRRVPRGPDRNRTKSVPALRHVIHTMPHVPLAPEAQLIKNLHERCAERGKRVLDPRRNLRELATRHKPIMLQFLEVRRERLIGNAAQVSSHLVETHRFVLHQAIENRRLVLTLDKRHSVAVPGLFIPGISDVLRHEPSFLCRAALTVSRCHDFRNALTYW